MRKSLLSTLKRLVGTSAKTSLSIFNCGYLFNLTFKTMKTTMKEQRERREKDQTKQYLIAENNLVRGSFIYDVGKKV